MPAKYLRWTKPGGEVVNLMIFDKRPDYDWDVIDLAKDQNKIRHMLSVLQQTEFCGFPALPDLWNVMVTFYDHEYRLWSYTRNWKTRSAFLAGICVGKKSRRWKRILRRKRRQRAAI